MSMANMKDRYWELMPVAMAYQPTDLCDNCGHCRDQHYLVTKGVEKNRVYTEGKGEKQPVADNKTAEGRAKNRRVEIEVVGTRAAM